jgi:PAS domain S-box-containing protein
VEHEVGDTLTWRPDPSILDGVGAAALVVDRALRIRYANTAAGDLLGHGREALSGRLLPSLLFAEGEVGAITEVLGQVISEPRDWRGDLPVLLASGARAELTLACVPMWDHDTVAGAVVIAERTGNTGRETARAHRFADRLTRLARVSTELLLADNIDAVTKVTIEHTADAAGATVSSLSLLTDDHTLALIAMRGGREGTASRWATYPLADRTPVGDCVRTGRILVLSGRDEIRASYPDLERAAEGERSMVCLPLRVAGRPIGGFAMSFPGRRVFDANELEFFGILADACAQAIDRVTAVAEAADQRLKLRFLADASSELASSLDYQTTLQRVADLAVPNFADWCSIQLLEEGELRTIAVAHSDPAKVALALDLQHRYPADPDAAHGGYHVLHTGRSELIPDIPDELLVAAARDEEHLRLTRELNLRSAITVPLKAHGRVLGVITWVAGDASRRFDETDLAFAEDLARRAAVAIDNSQLHSETREAAARLQRAVLPEALTPIPGWDLAALYLPAGRTEVGGDFYDVIALVDGRLVMFVGDVMGRGVAAAAAMAQMRSAVRAYLAIDPAPAAVLNMLDTLFERFELAQLVTLVYAVLDPARDELAVVNAGHPPPMVLRADGSTEQLPEPDGVPLGVGGCQRVATTVAMRPGDTLLAFSDGLIERRTEDIDIGQQRLRTALPLLAGPDLGRRLGDIVEQVRDHSRDDDIAALAVRRSPPKRAGQTAQPSSVVASSP